MKLSMVIPARDEAGNIGATVRDAAAYSTAGAAA
jgi:hypothetical protein